MMVRRTDHSRRLERGSALLITMFIMALMAIVGFAALAVNIDRGALEGTVLSQPCFVERPSGKRR